MSSFETTINLPFHALVFGAFRLFCGPWRVSLGFFLNLVKETSAKNLSSPENRPFCLMDDEFLLTSFK